MPSRVLAIMAILLLAFSLASSYVKPNDKDLLSLFGLLFPFIYIFSALTTIYIIGKRRISLLVLAILLIVGLPKILSFVKVGTQKLNAKSDISVLTYNVMMGFGLVEHDGSPSEEKIARLKDILSKEPTPDVLCFQEAGPLTIQPFTELQKYNQIHRLSPKGAVIYSSLPIIRRGHLDFGSKINSCLWADILVNEKDTIRIYSTHLESTRLSTSSYELLSERKSSYSAPVRGLRDLIMKYPTYAGKRAEQAKLVKDHIKACPHPVILCGDMNEPPVSYTYRLLKEDMTDAFVETGFGIGNTWKGKIPMLRIDYIFASEGLSNTSYTCLQSDLSDHFPVKATFTFED